MGAGACIGMLVWWIISIAIAAYSLYCMWCIAKKAGYEPWYGLLMIVPILNVVLLYYFAFTEWPIEKQRK